ncbi:xylose isomerase [Cricetibacter osteomyelitidis]|uniref:Xylose isomerase n=1 Tax=Cricetibacter osteomyelitidis TaxID=1521931 RepID=A0A4R2T1S3_9PAST|nr:TIM barrel protein [Cricetibacter osteomyelitidis]TCP96839.1 xylose isomerase [Cricetibacter osteomyelitidis]
MEKIKFATRLNSFASKAHTYWPNLKGKPSTRQVIERASTVKGLTDVDLNYPQHIHEDPKELRKFIEGCGLKVNGMAMRYSINPEFQLGAFTHPDAKVRSDAIELTKRGIDCGHELGTNLMTIWLGQDGFDYSFQANYEKMWDDLIFAFREIAEYAPDCDISIEYKPNEPRSFSILPDVSTTLLAIADIGAKNIGMTLDFAHVLYADEMPAFAASMIARRTKIMGLHLNDGYHKRDDGLMVASANPRATLELIWQLRKEGFNGAYYFDTFPDASGLDPVRECEVNIQTVLKLIKISDQLNNIKELEDAINQQDAVASQAIINEFLLGK